MIPIFTGEFGNIQMIQCCFLPCAVMEFSRVVTGGANLILDAVQKRPHRCVICHYSAGPHEAEIHVETSEFCLSSNLQEKNRRPVLTKMFHPQDHQMGGGITLNLSLFIKGMHQNEENSAVSPCHMTKLISIVASDLSTQYSSVIVAVPPPLHLERGGKTCTHMLYLKSHVLAGLPLWSI